MHIRLEVFFTDWTFELIDTSREDFWDLFRSMIGEQTMDVIFEEGSPLGETRSSVVGG